MDDLGFLLLQIEWGADEALDDAPGDRLRYIVDKSGVRLEKAQDADTFDPFASFTEWSSEEDEAAFADL